jgi:hypothetical protein
MKKLLLILLLLASALCAQVSGPSMLAIPGDGAVQVVRSASSDPGPDLSKCPWYREDLVQELNIGDYVNPGLGQTAYVPDLTGNENNASSSVDAEKPTVGVDAYGKHFTSTLKTFFNKNAPVANMTCIMFLYLADSTRFVTDQPTIRSLVYMYNENPIAYESNYMGGSLSKTQYTNTSDIRNKHMIFSWYAGNSGIGFKCNNYNRQFTVKSGTNSTPVPNLYHLGLSFSGTSTKIYYILVYDRILTQAETENVESWLRLKFNYTDTL